MLGAVISYLLEKLQEGFYFFYLFFFFRIRLGQTGRAVPMHEGALPQDEMIASADLKLQQNDSDELVSIHVGPLGLNRPILLSSVGCNYPSCGAAESRRIRTHSGWADLRRNRQKIGSVFTWGWDSFRPQTAGASIYLHAFIPICFCKLVGNVGRDSLLIHTVWIRSGVTGWCLLVI